MLGSMYTHTYIKQWRARKGFTLSEWGKNLNEQDFSLRYYDVADCRLAYLKVHVYLQI